MPPIELTETTHPQEPSVHRRFHGERIGLIPASIPQLLAPYEPVLSAYREFPHPSSSKFVRSAKIRETPPKNRAYQWDQSAEFECGRRNGERGEPESENSRKQDTFRLVRSQIPSTDVSVLQFSFAPDTQTVQSRKPEIGRRPTLPPD